MKKSDFMFSAALPVFGFFFVEGPVLGGTLPRQGREIKTGEVLASFGGGLTLSRASNEKSEEKKRYIKLDEKMKGN